MDGGYHRARVGFLVVASLLAVMILFFSIQLFRGEFEIVAALFSVVAGAYLGEHNPLEKLGPGELTTVLRMDAGHEGISVLSCFSKHPLAKASFKSYLIPWSEVEWVNRIVIDEGCWEEQQKLKIEYSRLWSPHLELNVPLKNAARWMNGLSTL